MSRSPNHSPNRSRLLFFVLSLLVVTSLVGGHWLADAVTGGEDESLYKYLATFTEVLGLVRQAYVDETQMGDLMTNALDGTTDALDPFSIYIPPSQVEPFLAARRTGKRLSGLTLLKERGIAYVIAVDAGSPADQAGVRPGDVVAKVDGESTRLEPLWAIQEALAGEAGSRVAMQLLRAGEELEVSFELTPFEAPVATLERVERGGTAAGVLHIARFEPATVGRVEALLGEARKAGYDRLLVDLRSTAGGDPAAAYGVAGLLDRRRARQAGQARRDARDLPRQRRAGVERAAGAAGRPRHPVRRRGAGDGAAPEPRRRAGRERLPSATPAARTSRSCPTAAACSTPMPSTPARTASRCASRWSRTRRSTSSPAASRTATCRRTS